MSLTSLAWIYLIIAGVLEGFWAIGLKYSEGFTRPLTTIITLILVASSFYLLSKAMNTIPVSVAYAIWCAIGIITLIIIESFYLSSVLNTPKILSILLILVGIVGLKLF